MTILNLDAKYKNINRRNSNSYCVQVRRKGIVYNSYFSDNVYKTQEKALKAAIQFRDNIISKHSLYSRKEAIERTYKTSTTGISNISVYLSPNGTRNWRFCYTTANGKRKSKTFSTIKYGEEIAKQMAIEYKTIVLDSLKGYINKGRKPLGK